jgi:triacylglycerol esterase/lipase EstA (alpha/beta hydrolase family)
MTDKTKMKDIVVILPGILGSVLQKDGTDLWNVSGQAIWQVVKTLGNRLQDLKLEGDDPNREDLGDGIKATSLIADTHIIPGFWKIDGYTKTSELITKNFDVIEGDIYNDSEDRAASFYHFPYDWRRDNRANARILKRLLDQRLKAWRDKSGNNDAKVILLAHSMGGLISRYYLEVLGGWQDCRALFTFGTPYRGSVNAVNFLANGYKQAFIDLTEVMRSLTSIYQLIPIYKVLQIGNESHRIAEVSNLPNIVQNKAKDALAFHREIETAVNSNRQNSKYLDAYATVPFVGVQQPTLQSAELKEGKIIVSNTLPIIMSGLDRLANGDGTVPQISAFPIEFSDRDLLEIPSFIAETHGSLQNQSDILLNLLNKLQIAQSAAGTIEDIRGRGKEESRSINKGKQGISLSLDDLYLKEEPIVIKARVNPDNSAFGSLKAQIEGVSDGTISLHLDFVNQGSEWVLKPEELHLASGLYRIKVETDNRDRNAPNGVCDLFEVAG